MKEAEESFKHFSWLYRRQKSAMHEEKEWGQRLLF
jgi:hypothetical protein